MSWINVRELPPIFGALLRFTGEVTVLKHVILRRRQSCCDLVGLSSITAIMPVQRIPELVHLAFESRLTGRFCGTVLRIARVA